MRARRDMGKVYGTRVHESTKITDVSPEFHLPGNVIGERLPLRRDEDRPSHLPASEQVSAVGRLHKKLLDHNNRTLRFLGHESSGVEGSSQFNKFTVPVIKLTIFDP